MSFHDAYRAFREFLKQVRNSLRQARTENTQIPGTRPTGIQQAPYYQSTAASAQSRRRPLSPPSNLQPEVLQSLPSQYRQQQTLTGGDGAQAVPRPLDPANFWGDLVVFTSPPRPFAGQWQSSHSLAHLANAIYNWADTELQPLNEGGLSPQKVGLLLSMGEYANEHNIYALCKQTASINSFGSKQRKENLINETMRYFYNLYDLSHNIRHDPSTSRSFFDSPDLTAPLPLLTREGYLRFILIGILIDPHTNFININKFLSKIPPLKNPVTAGTLPSFIPRYAFPAKEDPATKQYVDNRRQKMSTMCSALAAATIQQGCIGLDIARSLYGDSYGFTSIGTMYTGDWIGRGI